MEKVSQIKSKHGQRLGEKSIDNLKKKNSDTPPTLLIVISQFIFFDIETKYISEVKLTIHRKLTSSGGESANCGGAASVGRGTRGSKQVSLFRWPPWWPPW